MSTANKVQQPQTITARNGEKINLKTFFNTLQPLEHSGNYTAQIEIGEYNDLGCLIQSLISVCRGAIENSQLNTDPIEIIRVLEVVQDLIPFEELEFLDEVRPF